MGQVPRYAEGGAIPPPRKDDDSVPVWISDGHYQPFTSSFGAVPKPEEPARPGYDNGAPLSGIPGPLYGSQPEHGGPLPIYGSDNRWHSAPPPVYAAPSYSPFAPQGPQANAAVVNNIRIGGPRPFNHTLHLTLTLLTCGMWAPVWIIAYLLHPKG